MVNVGLRGFLWEAKPPGHRCAREVWALGGAGGPTYHALRAFLLHANEHGFPGPGADASSGARPLAAAAPGPHPPAFAFAGPPRPFARCALSGGLAPAARRKLLCPALLHSVDCPLHCPWLAQASSEEGRVCCAGHQAENNVKSEWRKVVHFASNIPLWWRRDKRFLREQWSKSKCVCGQA